MALLRPAAVPRADAPTLTKVATPRTQPSLERRRTWERRYVRRLRATDGAIVVCATAATAALDYLLAPSNTHLIGAARVACVVCAAWAAVLWLWRTREPSIVGWGGTEYKRVANSSGFALGILAMLFVVFQWEGLRFQLTIALPVGLVALLLGRWLWRKWLIAQRGFGHYTSRVVIAGTRDDVEYVIRSLSGAGQHGYVVVGATMPEFPAPAIEVDSRSYPVIGSMHATAAQARAWGADTIIVAGQPDDDPDFIKRLSWQLEGTAAELILSSRLIDVAGPRISLRQIEGLPLINVKIPEYEGSAHAFKRALDVVFSSLALIPIALLTPFIAAAIRIDSRGPVFFQQTRVGRDGREFKIFKFRTMASDAESRLAALVSQNEGSGLLFKMKSDPRITRVGAFLRKYSLDELPQFFNVLRGDMSVVGPRPPLPSEVTSYDGTVFRRLYIKPGITGLWQVSGRSDLTWDESVRLDLRYVENWSLTNDLQIMWRTAKVMVAPRGAY
ncbi:sugar transferase [Microbacterium sp. B2969]|uniref:Sugar transferase n=1 Tax=Microbacterium alkaliflavum TaxID=3248839 RepID=A0ABW7QB24_9MICO